MTKTRPSVMEAKNKIDAPWTALPPHTFRCEVRIEKEGNLFVANVAELRGVVSQGESVDEARCNIEEALRATIATYLEEEMTIPWEDRPEPWTEEQQRFWVFVNV